MSTFSKISKTFNFGAILLPFCPNLKKRPSRFLNIPIIYHHAKIQKKINDPFLRKMLHGRRDRQTDKQKDRQTD